MIRITKKQRDYLEAHGCTYPEDLHHNHGSYKSWYATENKKVKDLLAKMNREIIQQ